jgi:hypothetical protein
MTDLTGKFGQLETLITTKFDAVILKLDNIHTALSSAGGNIEAAPIVAAIEALRGIGPENTIKAINQSVWNIAGPAPGKSITDLHTLLTAQHAAIGVYLAAIGADTDATANALGIPTGDATTTALGLLASVQYALTYNGANAANLFGAIRAINDALGGVPNNSLALTSVRGLLDMLTTQQRSLLDPISVAPVDVCETSYTSSGYVYYQMNMEVFPGFPLTTPGTLAIWSAPPSGYTITRNIDISQNYTKLNSNDWLSWRIYVASTASTFGVSTSTLSSDRFPTNQWITLSPGFMTYNDLSFLVDGSDSLKVYICPAATLVGGTAPSGADFSASTATSVVNGRRYLVWPDLDGITESAGGVELTPATSWTGYEVFIQSSAPSATLHDVTEPAQDISALAVGQWHPLGQGHTLAFSVDGAYQAKGYMRLPTAPVYYDLASSNLYNAQRIAWPNNPPYFVPHPNYSDTAVNNFSGWTLTTISGGPISLSYGNAGASNQPLITLENGVPQVFTSTAAHVWTSSGAPFVLRMTPP